MKPRGMQRFPERERREILNLAILAKISRAAKYLGVTISTIDGIVVGRRFRPTTIARVSARLRRADPSLEHARRLLADVRAE